MVNAVIIELKSLLDIAKTIDELQLLPELFLSITIDNTHMKASRTINPLHFEDLEPHRFEDLVRQLAYGFKTWSALEDRGKLGGDEGKDILGIEQVKVIGSESSTEEDDERSEPLLDEREWRIQCKRYKTITPKQMTDIVREVVPDSSKPPYGIIIAAPCNISDKSYTAFHNARIELGVKEGHIWSKSKLEDLLFAPENDHLLFVYFGISLTLKTKSLLTEVRNTLSIKRKLRRAAKYVVEHKSGEHFLVRDINDDTYFSEGGYAKNLHKLCASWHPVSFEIDAPDTLILYASGISLEVLGYHGQVKSDGTWDICEGLSINFAYNQVKGPLIEMETFECEQQHDERFSRLRSKFESSVPEKERCIIELHKMLPYRNILEIDMEGDSVYDYPHLLCNFNGETGPYLQDDLFYNDTAKEQLDISKRKNYLRHIK